MLIQREHTKIGRDVQWPKPAAAVDDLLHHLRDWISVGGGNSFISYSRFMKNGGWSCLSILGLFTPLNRYIATSSNKFKREKVRGKRLTRKPDKSCLLGKLISKTNFEENFHLFEYYLLTLFLPETIKNLSFLFEMLICMYTIAFRRLICTLYLNRDLN